MIRNTPRKLFIRLLLDVLSVWLALAAAEYLRTQIPIGMVVPRIHWVMPPLLYLIAPIVWIVGLYAARVYDPGSNLTTTLEIGNLAIGHLGAGLLLSGVLYATFRDYSRLQTIYVIVASFLLLAGHRLINKWLNRNANERDVSRIVIVGTDDSARRFEAVIDTHQPAHLKVVGYVTWPGAAPSEEFLSSPVLGNVNELPAIIERLGIDEIIISTRWFDQRTNELIEQILQEVESFPVNVRLGPDYSDLAYFHASAEMFYGMALIGIREPVFTPYERVVKRLIDVMVSVTALVICLPLFALIAIAIRLDSPGPVLLRQKRVGYRGRLFGMYKFRSMVFEPEGQSVPGHSFNVVKMRDDPRITRVGAILRRSSLDELPQFYNVLIGDMSLVGPRPEIPEMVNQYARWQRKRFEVPQGMTGWWQINGRADRPMYFYTSDDLFYIRNYSIWLDLWIIFRTVFAVIFGRGAY